MSEGHRLALRVPLERVTTTHSHGSLYSVAGYNANDEGPAWAFLKIFAWRGTIYPSVIPQCIFFGLWAFACCWNQDGHNPVAVPKSWSNVYSAIGFFLSFLLSIRVSSSNNLNGEALILIGNIRGACRNMAKASCNYALKSNDAKTLDEVTGLRVSIRRHCDLLWAFMRQDLRESREGFHPKSDMAKVAFGPSTYMDDPALPLLIDRLTDKEMEMYATLSTSERVVTTARKLSKELHLMSQFMVCQNEYAANANSFCDGAVQKWSACRKVLDLSIPFVFKHMLYNLLFVFCLVTPFVQFQNDHVGTRGLTNTQFIMVTMISILVAAVYFGVMAACARLSDPFGWDANDMDLEGIGLAIVAQGNRVTETAMGRPCKYIPGTKSNAWSPPTGSSYSVSTARDGSLL